MKQFGLGILAALCATAAFGQLARTPPAAPRPITLGQTVEGRLTEISPLAEDETPYEGYSFTGRRGQSVIIEMKSRAFDPYVALMRDGYDRPVKSNDDGGGGLNARVLAVLPVDGVYEIRANSTEEGSRGPFSLTLSEGPPRVLATPRPIAYGEVVTGELAKGDAIADDGSFYDLYRFKGRAGDAVTIELRSAEFDTFVGLAVANGGRPLADNDDADPAVTDSQIRYVLPADAEYEIMANTLAHSGGGRYRVGVMLTPR